MKESLRLNAIKVLRFCIILLVFATYVAAMYMLVNAMKEESSFPTVSKLTTAKVVGNIELGNYVDIELTDIPTKTTIYIPSKQYIQDDNTVSVYYHPEYRTLTSITKTGEKERIIFYFIACFVFSYMLICTLLFTVKINKN